MDYQVALSPSARNDIEDIVRYISFDAPARALEFGAFILTKTKELGSFPNMGREVPEIENPAIREIIVRSYRVVYRINHSEKIVEVIRFWHAARGTPETR